MSVILHHGKLEDVLPTIAADSIDACVTDTPYHLTAGKKGGAGDASVNPNSPAGRAMIGTGFMGMKWDGGDVAFRVETWRAVYRVLKPGAYLLAFGGTRTHHRMVCAIEDAGFEIRDEIDWLYGSGFPKSLNLDGEWDGWGTALKPAKEPICVARKPMIGTTEQNLAAHRTGAINIDACRIPFAGAADEAEAKEKNQHTEFESGPTDNQVYGKFAKPREDYNASGRWPANVIHDGSPEVVAAFPDTDSVGHFPASRGAGGVGCNGHSGQHDLPEGHLDSGSAARFFYCAKASKADREDGCELLDSRKQDESRKEGNPGGDNPRNRSVHARKNFHPTVKPTALMRYLCRLITPAGGTVLDVFMGSGSTGRGAVLGGVQLRWHRNDRRVSADRASAHRRGRARKGGRGRRKEARRCAAGARTMKGALPEGYITPAQLAVWRQVALGQPSKTIALLLGVGIKTVDKHRCELLRKLCVHSSADLTRKAVEHGVITVEVRPLQVVQMGARTWHVIPEPTSNANAAG